MSLGEKRDQEFIDDLSLSDDDFFDLVNDLLVGPFELLDGLEVCILGFTCHVFSLFCGGRGLQNNHFLPESQPKINP